MIFIYKRLSYEGINYLDDLGSAELQNKAWQAYHALGKLLDDLNIWEAKNKAMPPSTVMVFLGALCDLQKFSLQITADRLRELGKLLDEWLNKTQASLNEVQSLVGKLNFVCSTVRAGRVFMCRVLNFLCEFNS